MAEVAPSASTRLGAAGSRSANERPPASYALPEGGVETRIDEASEFLPLRVERLELFRSHARVFRRVHAAAVFEGDASETIDQIEADVAADGKVEGEHGTGFGKGHHADRGDVAEELDDGEEGGEAGFGDGLEDFDHSFAAALMREDVLKLEQALPAVHAVPVEHSVEGIEKRLVVDGADFLLGQLLMEVEGIERGHGEAIQREFRQAEGERQLWLFAPGQRAGSFGVIALHEDAARKIAAG